jgi:CheY-like chemotaxis protein
VPIASEDTQPAPLSKGSETILVVEDNEPLRELIGSVLSGAHYSTIVCADGATAIEQMRSGAAVDAALLDVVLPRMSGMELADQLRLFRPETKVLFMSGYAEEAVQCGASAIEAGMQFIQKPFSVYELCARLRQVLDAPLVS